MESKREPIAITPAIEKNFEAVKKIVYLGDENTSGPHKAENALAMRFMQKLQDRIFGSSEIVDFCENDDWKRELFRAFLLGMCAEIYHCSNCGGQACLALTQFIKNQEVNQGLELIHLDGLIYKDDKKKRYNHCFLLINRDVKDSDRNEPETWRNVILFDTWGPAQKLKCYSPTTSPTRSILSSKDEKSEPLLDIDTILPTFRIEKNLTVDQWQDVTKFLKLTKKLLNKKLIEALLVEAGRINVNPDKELKLIQNKIQEEIDFIKKNKIPSVTLFSAVTARFTKSKKTDKEHKPGPTVSRLDI